MERGEGPVQKVKKFLVRFFSSCGFLGFLPAPGAWGSLVGFALAWYFSPHLIYLLGFFTLFGYVLTLGAKQAFSSGDPGPFVMDETCGMMLSVVFLPHTLSFYIAAYVLFRVLDVWKPGPIGLLEKKWHPYSIMNDDMAAGLFTNLILQAVLVLTSRIGI